MYIAVKLKEHPGQVVCTGQSEGQVRRILIQKGLNFLDYDIRYIEDSKEGVDNED